MASDGLHSWRAPLRKTYFVHIAASLRHGELYGKKPYDFLSELDQRVREYMEIFWEGTRGWLSCLRQYTTENQNPAGSQVRYRSLKSQRQTHLCPLYCRLPVYKLRGKVTEFDLAFYCGCFMFSSRGAMQRAHHGKGSVCLTCRKMKA